MNVLLLTDFSSGAKHAHKYALNLFADTEVDYFLLHSNYEGPKFKISNDLQLEHEVIEYKKWDSNRSKFTSVSTSNSLIDAIRNMMKSHPIDLVVMGANGDSQEKSNNSLGHNTESIATKIKCPVLIVFQRSIIKIPVNVAFPIDYIDILKVSCIEKLKTLPNSHRFTIEVIEINARDSAPFANKITKNNLKRGLEPLTMNFKKENDLNIECLETIDKKGFDLISFGAKNLSVYNLLFDQLKNINESKLLQPPLYILHA